MKYIKPFKLELSIKNFVALSLFISFLGMGLILTLGYSQIKKIDSASSLTPQDTNDSTQTGLSETGALENLNSGKQVADNKDNQPTDNSGSNGGNGGSTSTGGASGGSTGGTSGGTSGTGGTGAAPKLSLSINKTSMTAGDTANISWSVSEASGVSCTASGSWSGSKSTSGSQNVSPAAGSYTYALSCAGAAGSSSKSVSLSVGAASSCGSGGSCSLADVSSHNTQSDCWVIVKYTASGGNGGNGQVYKISSSFFGSSGTHNGLPSAPSLSASSWCGKNISSTFNSKHNGGSRSADGNTAIWWLTNNGNSLIGPYSGS